MSTPILLEDPAIPFGSPVCVTGVNGLLGSHIADQALFAGYNVRGTVRNLDKNAWMNSFFAKRYAHSNVRFELVAIPDMSIDGCFDEAVRDCVGVIHTTSSLELQATKPEPTITDSVKTVMTCLHAAAQELSVKRFVLTSSAWTVAPPRPDVKFVVSPEDWNEQAVKDAYAKGTPASNSLSIYMAGKLLGEKAAWQFVREQKPHFVFNTIHPDTVFGRVLSPENQGIPSTAGFVKMLFEGKGLDMVQWVAPQYHCDTEDVGRLHVAALIHPGCENERLLGHADRWNWNDMLAMFRRWYPDNTFPQDLHLGSDISTVEDAKSRELLKDVYGQERWVGLEASVRQNVDSFLRS